VSNLIDHAGIVPGAPFRGYAATYLADPQGPCGNNWRKPKHAPYNIATVRTTNILRYEITKLAAMVDDPGLSEAICEPARQLLRVAKVMQ
jgi:hypothetical protein